MKYEAILYDMDGTVLDTAGDLCDSMNHALSLFSLPPVSEEQTKQYLGNGARRFTELACPPDADKELLEKVFTEYKMWYNTHCHIRTAPYTGIIPLMTALKERGIRQAIISNKPDAAVRQLAAEYFPGLLELAVGESAGVRRKPAPDSVLKAAEQMAVALDRCVYIGDSEVDIATAKNAGMSYICVSWGFRSAQQLKNAGAEMIVHSVGELAEFLL